MLSRCSICFVALRKLAVSVVAVAPRSVITVLQHGQCTQCASRSIAKSMPEGLTRISAATAGKRIHCANHCTIMQHAMMFAVCMSSDTSWDVHPEKCAPARLNASRGNQMQSLEFKFRTANRRTMRRVDSSDAAPHIYRERMRAICEECLHWGGAARTRLTSLTDTRTTAERCDH